MLIFGVCVRLLAAQKKAHQHRKKKCLFEKRMRKEDNEEHRAICRKKILSKRRIANLGNVSTFLVLFIRILTDFGHRNEQCQPTRMDAPPWVDMCSLRMEE